MKTALRVPVSQAVKDPRRCHQSQAQHERLKQPVTRRTFLVGQPARLPLHMERLPGLAPVNCEPQPLRFDIARPQCGVHNFAGDTKSLEAQWQFTHETEEGCSLPARLFLIEGRKLIE